MRRNRESADQRAPLRRETRAVLEAATEKFTNSSFPQRRESILTLIFNANRRNWMNNFAFESAAFAETTTQSEFR
jgi:hypothetical protein